MREVKYGVNMELDVLDLIEVMKPQGLPDFTVYQYYKNLQKQKNYYQ